MVSGKLEQLQEQLVTLRDRANSSCDADLRLLLLQVRAMRGVGRGYREHGVMRWGIMGIGELGVWRTRVGNFESLRTEYNS